MYILEFCEKCGGLMIPFDNNNEKFLKCKACGNKIPLDKDLIESYIFTTIFH